MIATFVLGDVVGSTRMWTEHAERMPDALTRLDTVVDAAARAHDGERPMEQGEGDSFVVTFGKPSDALAFAIDVQQGLTAEDVSLRMAVHTGEAEQRDDGRWLGPTLNRCARLRALAAGGQVLLSAATAALVVDSLPEGATLRDLGSHRLRDLATPEQVRQLCHPDLIDDFPALRSLGRLPNNLPVQLTTFVGRVAELDRVGTLVDAHRLVTLTGAGGAGKTPLALHVVAERLDAAPDGVWLADLAGVVDPGLVATVLAAAMGLAEQPRQPILDTVANRLADANAVVVIDNCEHLLDASAALAERLVQSCPGVRVVATSREPLGVDGEVVYRVPSLSLPADDDTTSDAVVLFCDRARAVRPSFALDSRTLPAVAAICRRLDGLPLAIELAAARCRAMAPAEIAAQLAERFSLLSAGRRGALPRQRTLEASIQWSHDLLSPEEQVVLRRMSVFAGGFTLATAEQVCAGDGVVEWQVVDLITSLVDRSLVHPDDDAEHTRYRLLETVRVFAAGRLADAREVGVTRDRHLAAMVELTSALRTEVRQAGVAGLLAVPGQEVDNCRAALDWATETADFTPGARMVLATNAFWSHNLVAEGYRRAHSVLAVPGGDARLRALLLMVTADLAYWRADWDAYHELTEAAVGLSPHLDDVLRARIDVFAGTDLAFGGHEGAVDLLRGAVARLEELGEAWYLAYGLAMYATTLAAAGDLRRAQAVADRGLQMGERMQDPLLFCGVAMCAAFVARQRGDARALETCAASILALASGISMVADAEVPILVASIASAAGHHHEAISALDDQLTHARDNGVGLVLNVAGTTRLMVGRRAGAPWDPALADEVSSTESQSNPKVALLSFLDDVDRHLAQEQIDAAREAALRAVRLADSTPYAGWARPSAGRALARAYSAAGDLLAAENLAHDALALSETTGEDVGVAEGLELLAAMACATSAHLDAARMLGAANTVRSELGWVPGVREQAALDRLIAELIDSVGPSAYEAALAEGRALGRSEAVAFVGRGRGKRGRPTFGWSSLTPTETEVVRLVAEGLANKAIAEKLLMSPATVKTHLTHVYAKLGVANRAELAGEAARRPG